MSTLKEKIKENPAEWIAIVISFLVGFSSLFTSLYSLHIQQDIANQQNSTQKQIVQLQANIQRNNSFAHLEIRSTTNSSFEMSNSGPATADNVKMVIAILAINPMWKKSLTDINKFVLQVSNPSLISSLEKTSVLIQLQQGTEIVGKNAFIIDINTLPPGEIVNFTVGLAPTTSIKSYAITRNINIYLKAFKKPFTSDDEFSLNYPIFDQYLSQKFWFAAFEVVSSCNNCNVNYNPIPIDNKIPDKFSNATDDVQNAQDLFRSGLPILATPSVIYNDEFFAGEIEFPGEQVNRKFYQSNGNASMSIKMPAISDPISLPSPVNLKAILFKSSFDNVNGTTSYYLYFQLTECLPSDCMNFDNIIPTGG